MPAADPYEVQADAFSAAIRSDAPAPIPPEDSIGNLAVIERILAAPSPAWPLSTADFVVVLSGYGHGAASGGRPRRCRIRGVAGR